MTTARRDPLAWSLDGMVWAWREHADRDDIAEALERASLADALAYTRCFVRCHAVDAAPDMG